MRTWVLCLVSICLSACGPSVSGDDGADDAPAGPHLRIEPGDVTLSVSDGVPATQAYVVLAVDEGGGEHDVTDEATLTVAHAALGTFDGAVFTSAPDRAGRTTVRAAWEGLDGEAELTIRLRHVIVEPGVSVDAPDRFETAADGGAAPELVYPASGVIVPPNLNALEVHFLPGAGNDVFELGFTGDLIELLIYVACTPVGGGCAWLPSEDTWEILATASRGEPSLWYQVRGLGASGQVGTSTSRWIQFAADDLLGGIYYWNAGAGAIMRYEFGRRGQSAERFLGVGETGATQCVGCHSLTRDGQRIAVGIDIPGPAGVEAYDVASRSMLWSAGGFGGGGFPSGEGANFTTFSPDGAQLLGSDGSVLWLRDSASGGGRTTVVQNAMMPDWAPDGGRVVFARSAQASPFPGALGTSGGSLYTVDAATWQQVSPLVVSGGASDNNYYPSYSPDGALVAFNKSALEDSYDATDARVWVVPSAGGAAVPLGNASPAPGGDSWPKWGPFVHAYADGEVMWLTFSSRRAYGLRGGGTAQIWMVGVDAGRLADGGDPSFAAFWLPFQDLASGNHIAQWAEVVEREECDNDSDCGAGEFCDDGGVCLPDVE